MTSLNDDPAAPLQRLATALRSIRVSAGLDQADLAPQLGISQPQVSKIETGRRVPSDALIRQWARVVTAAAEPVVDVDSLIELRSAAAAERISWSRVHRDGIAADQRAVESLEQGADSLWVFQPSVIPGQLQTGAYARRLLELGTTADAAAIAAGVQARLERQAVLYNPPAGGCHFMITEAALRWRPDGDSDGRLLAAQLDRLLALVDLPGVDIRVLPWDRPQPATHRHPFVMLLLPEEDDEPQGGTVIVETIDGEDVIRATEKIELYRAWYERLAVAALRGPDAGIFVRRLINELHV